MSTFSETVQLEGAEKLRAQLRKKGQDGVNALSRGLMRAGLYLQRESQLIVPIDTSALKNSARTTFVPGSGARFRDGKGRFSKSTAPLAVAVTYGTAYAIYVHEDLYASHAPGKVAKFLEKPANEKQPEMSRIIANEVDSV